MSEFAARLGRLRRELARLEASVFYCCARPNIRYLTGFSGSSGHLLVGADFLALFTDGRYRAQAASETAGLAGLEIVVSEKRPPFEDLLDALRDRRVRRLAIETQRLSHAAARALAALRPRLALVETDGPVERLRMVKSEAEIEIVRQAAALNSRAFEAVAGRWRPSWTERRAAAEIDYEIVRLGGEGPAFPTIVAGGERSALPHASPTGARPPRRSLVVVDHGAILGGYASDMTRMLCWGTPGERLREVFDAVREAQQAALEAVRAGVRAKSVDRAARRAIEKRGFGEFFPHSTGHGVGLEIHERPKLGRDEKLKLKPGMVVTIEPGVYVEGLGGARVEDLVVVRPNGCEILSPTPNDLLVL